MKPLNFRNFSAGYIPAGRSAPRRKGALLFAAALFAQSLAAAAAPGDLDVTLAGTGKMRVLAGGGLDTGYAVARQGDGKLIVAGESHNMGVTVVSLARYLSNGTPDPAFGTGGKVLLTDLFGGARAVTVVPVTGQILVAGYAALSPSNSAFLLARLNADGTPDATFDGNGYLFTDITPGLDIAMAMALNSDGRIVLGGETGDQMAMTRYNANGTLDTSFDGDGTYTSTFARRVNALLLQGQKVVVAGRTESFGSGAIALRLNFNGSLDTTFSQPDGIDTRTNIGHAYGIMSLAVLAGEEKLILTGGRPGGQSGGPIPVPIPPEFALWSLNAADGSPDTTFASGGTFSELENPGRSVRVQLSGGVASRIVVGIGGSTVRRFTLTGGVDSTFGGVTGRGSAGFSGDAMLVQPDGRIVVAGSDNGDMAIGRFTAGGALDTSFSGDGLRRDNLSNALAAARAVAVQPDGKLLVAGDFSLVRLLPDGSFDPTFDEDGKVSVNFTVHALALQADGRVVLAGTGMVTTEDGELSIVRLARVNADGAFEFGVSATNSTPGTAHAVQVLADGKIVVAGAVSQYLVDGGPTIQKFAVFRFFANGMPDQSFGDRGAVTGPALGVAEEYSARALAIQLDGRIVASGSWPGAGSNYDFGVMRLTSNGEPDTSFSGDGIAVIPVGTGHDYAEAVAIHNGRIIVAGTLDTSNDDIGLIRLRTDGELDDSFGIGGKVIGSLSSGNDTLKALIVQSDGKLVICGSSTYLATTGLSLVRFYEHGDPDRTFGTGGQVNIDFTPGNLDAGYAMALDPVQRVVLAAAATDRYGIARVLGDPFLELTGMTREASTGMVTIHGRAAPGYTYSLRSAPDLATASFTILSVLTPAAPGAWQFSHMPGATRLFYKATRP